MHAARTPSKYVDKAGNTRRYESVLVRRSYREGGKVKHHGRPSRVFWMSPTTPVTLTRGGSGYPRALRRCCAIRTA
jgi:hypothetical protein